MKLMERRLLGLEEAANMLDVKTGTLYNWVWQRRIPFVKCGRLVKFDIKDLEQWIELNKVDPNKFALALAGK